MGWSTPNDSTIGNFNEDGYNRLFRRWDNTRPTNTGEKLVGTKNLFLELVTILDPHILVMVVVTKEKTGIKKTVTLTYHPNKFRANVENKPDIASSLSQKFTAFDLRFDSSGDLHDHTNSSFPFTENSTGTDISLPDNSDVPDALKTEGFKRFQRGSVAIASFSQPDNRYSNIQIADLPRYIPSKNATNKPMPKAQNLYYYMDEDYYTINRIYGLLSKSYDPQGEHLELLVQHDGSSDSCAEIGTVSGDLA